MAITITQTAADKINLLIQEKGLPATAGLRFGIRGGGCAGFEYQIDLAVEATKFDLVFEKDGAKVFCDKKSYLLTNGTEIDYQKTLMTQGFIFKNPNAKGSCGCGISFSI